MIAISCCTPYHIINAINLKLNLYKDKEVDLFICAHFQGAKKVHKRLMETKLFNNVYLIYDEKLSLKEVNKMKLFNNFSVLGIKASDFRYDIFHISAYSNFNMYMARYLKNKNKTKIVFVEDGLGTYVVMENFKSESKIKNILKWFIKDFNLDYIDECMVYDKRLMQINQYKKVEELPNINQNKQIKEVLNYVFKFENYDISKYKYILLDQKSVEKFEYDKWKEIYFNLKKITNKDDIIIKIHPREIKDKYEDAIIYDNYGIPMELLFINAENESIFITIHSTAAFSNSIIFKRKTTVVLLYKIFNIYNEEVEKYINSVKKYYDVNIFVPNNEKELKNIIKQFSINN